MSFTWPWALAALLALPVLAAAWWWSRRRRRRDAVRVSSLVVLRTAVPHRSPWRRRIPAALLVAALAVLGVAAARPQASVAVPENGTTIVLAIDMSSSMCETDVSPNRLVAAQAAATAFVKSQAGTRIGLVAFSGSATQLVAPTTDTDELLDAIAGLQVSRGTAIGLGILTAIDSIASVDPDVVPTGGATGDEAAATQPDVVVVLTDGANSQGVDPVTAAEQAAARGLRVYTIGFGTDTPTTASCTADQIAGGAAAAGPGGGTGASAGGRGGQNQEIDEDTLTAVADATGGQYVRAQDAQQLTDVLTGLPSSLVVVHEEREITSWFVAGAVALLLVGLGLAAWWGRVRVRSRYDTGRQRPSGASSPSSSHSSASA